MPSWMQKLFIDGVLKMNDYKKRLISNICSVRNDLYDLNMQKERIQKLIDEKKLRLQCLENDLKDEAFNEKNNIKSGVLQWI